MITFFDSSVLIASCQQANVHHALSLNAFAASGEGNTACSVHSLAEVYSVLTGMSGGSRVPADLALLFLDQVRQRCRLIALNNHEYTETIAAAARNRCIGGAIYDALLLACARKSKADQILTWNLRDFHRIAPDLADRIRTP